MASTHEGAAGAQPIILTIDPETGERARRDPARPLLYFDDSAVERGDGIFETILLHRGKPRNVERHERRFRRSAALLELPEPNLEHWRAATREAVDLWRAERADADGRVKWLYSRGRAATGRPSAWLTIQPVGENIYAQRDGGVRAMTTSRGYTIDEPASDAEPRPHWLSLGAKSLDYAATQSAVRAAKRDGFDDVIFVDKGADPARVLEGATSTLVTVTLGEGGGPGTLATPAAAGDILPGTTKAAVFEHAEERGWECVDKEMTVDDLLAADGVWLLSSVRLAVRVTNLDGRELPEPKGAGEIRRLFEAGLGVES